MLFSQCWSYAKQVVKSIKKNRPLPFTSETTQFAYIIHTHTNNYQNLPQKTDYETNLELYPQAQIQGTGELYRCLNTKCNTFTSFQIITFQSI